MTKCEEGVLRTLAFFDVFDFSPTLFELWRWQLGTDRVYTIEEVRAATGVLKGKVVSDGVLYGLPGCSLEQRAHQRRLRTLHAIRKNKKALRYVRRFARLMPGVQGIAVCNTRLPFLYAEHNSDIDLLVVARAGRIWSVRMLLVGFLKLLRRRPGEVTEDAFDHSMFVSDGSLDFEAIADINPIYVAAWVASLDPVYGSGALWNGIARNNTWVKRFFPAYEAFERIPRWRTRQVSRVVVALGAWALLPFEQFARTWQMRNFTALVVQKLNRSTAVVAHDGMLKFHTNDRRKQYLETYESLCVRMNVSVH